MQIPCLSASTVPCGPLFCKAERLQAKRKTCQSVEMLIFTGVSFLSSHKYDKYILLPLKGCPHIPFSFNLPFPAIKTSICPSPGFNKVPEDLADRDGVGV